MKIEPLKEESYDFIIQNLNQWFSGRNMTDMLPRLFFRHFKNTSFIATSGDKLAGFLVAFFSASDKEVGYIHFVGVHPDFRRQGIGKKLYQAFFNLCADHSVKIINCVTSPINETSIAYHHYLGFKASNYKKDGTVAPVLNYDGPGNHRILFAKEL